MRKIAILLISVVWVLSGCGGNKNTASPSPTSAGTQAPAGTVSANADAEAIYKANCISCHGVDLEGKMGAKTNLQHVGTAKSKDQINTQIANGGNGMMAFKGKLSDDQIKVLAEWLSAKK